VPSQQKYADKVFVSAAAYIERKYEAFLRMYADRTLRHSIKESNECTRTKLQQTFAFNDPQMRSS
jgi:hypothetical protein